jgi:hypothetical protein
MASFRQNRYIRQIPSPVGSEPEQRQASAYETKSMPRRMAAALRLLDRPVKPGGDIRFEALNCRVVLDLWQRTSSRHAIGAFDKAAANRRAIMSKLIAMTVIAFVAAFGGYLLAAKMPVDMFGASSPDRPVWTEGTWPFLIDQWGQGWVFQCKAADCGTELDLYLRPKIGFCNCQTGVADDAELDRVSDVDLFSSERTALGPGRPVTVQWMKGRSRAYKVGAPSGKQVLSLAFNNRCDVIVATVVAGDQPIAKEQAVLKFLNGDLMLEWAQGVLGL